MMKKSAFDESRPKTHRAEVLKREREKSAELQENFEALLGWSEPDFRKFLWEQCKIKPGHPLFEPALKLWRDQRRP